MKPEYFDILLSVGGILITAFGARLTTLVNAWIKKVNIQKYAVLNDLLNEAIKGLILYAQQNLYDKDGAFRADFVRGRIKEHFGNFVEKLGLTDAQLDIIIKNCYETLRSQNYGERFSAPQTL
jgi:hypothetical protein